MEQQQNSVLQGMDNGCKQTKVNLFCIKLTLKFLTEILADITHSKFAKPF